MASFTEIRRSVHRTLANGIGDFSTSIVMHQVKSTFAFMANVVGRIRFTILNETDFRNGYASHGERVKEVSLFTMNAETFKVENGAIVRVDLHAFSTNSFKAFLHITKLTAVILKVTFQATFRAMTENCRA